MIKLASNLVKTTQVLVGGNVVDTVSVDTIRLSHVDIDFPTGQLRADIQFGVLDANGHFTETDTPAVVLVNADGSFTGNYSGRLDAAAFTGAVAQIRASLEAFIIASGLAQGTQV